MRKATISFVISVCLSSAWNNSALYWTGILKVTYLCIFRNSVEKIHVLLESNKINLLNPTGNYTFHQV
jgi:hypothetical protein